MMSMSAREQQVLACIAGQLAASDPELAALMATFARLTSGDAMPAREEIRVAWHVPGARRGRRGRWRARRLREMPVFLSRRTPLGFLLAAAVLVAAVLIAVTVALEAAGSGTKCINVAIACIAPVPSSSAGSAVRTAAGPALRGSLLGAGLPVRRTGGG